MKRRLQILILLGLIPILMGRPILGQESPLERADRAGANPSTPIRKPGQRTIGDPAKQFADPRRWVFIAVVGFLVVGGGRKWLSAKRGRQMADKLAENKATPDEIRSSARHGRLVVQDLFRVMAEGVSAEHRLAATESLVRLWRADELIPEEEKAIVTRSLVVDWQIRRKYPRLLSGQIQIRALFGVPKLVDHELNSWLMEHLRWSYRVTGTRRAADDAWTVCKVAPARVGFEIITDDFPEDGPHRLILHLRLKTHELTDNWELDLPAQSTSFDWDDHLQPGALVTLPDSQRAELWASSIVFMGASGDDASPVFVQLDHQFALRNPVLPALKLPIPCDLAHRMMLEIENVAGRWSAGEWIESAQTMIVSDGVLPKIWPEKAFRVSGDESGLTRGGQYRMRVVLEPNPERGWSDPMIRSVWPDSIVSEWVNVDVVRN